MFDRFLIRLRLDDIAKEHLGILMESIKLGKEEILSALSQFDEARGVPKTNEDESDFALGAYLSTPSSEPKTEPLEVDIKTDHIYPNNQIITAKGFGDFLTFPSQSKHHKCLI